MFVIDHQVIGTGADLGDQSGGDSRIHTLAVDSLRAGIVSSEHAIGEQLNLLACGGGLNTQSQSGDVKRCVISYSWNQINGLAPGAGIQAFS